MHIAQNMVVLYSREAVGFGTAQPTETPPVVQRSRNDLEMAMFMDYCLCSPWY